jgi:hypothetical protein
MIDRGINSTVLARSTFPPRFSLSGRSTRLAALMGHESSTEHRIAILRRGQR